MTAVTVTAPPSWVLPRATSVTDILLAPAGAGALAVDRDDVRRRMESDLAQVTAGPPLRVDGRLVRAVVHGDRANPATPFEWSARAAGRVLGLAALRECATDPRVAPAQAVRDALRDRRSGHPRAGHPTRGWNASLERWLLALPPGGRRAVLVEALDWTTTVHGALDWGRIGPGSSVGGADLWWNSAHRVGVGVRARSEVRLRVPTAPDDPLACNRRGAGWAVLSVLPGWAGPTSRAELCVTALGHLLAPAAPLPTVRVVGYWPQSGQALALAVDDAAVREAADVVIRTVVSARAHDR
jgi:hypothetical protein